MKQRLETAPERERANASKVLLVCDSDSNAGFATRFAGFARARGVECDVIFCAREFALANQASHARLPDAPMQVLSDWRRLFEGSAILDYDLIFPMITGKDVPRFCETLRKAALSYGMQRPRTVGGFIGEWISAEPQIIERTGLDHFLVNRADELALFKSIASKFSFGCRFAHVPYPFVSRHEWARPLEQRFSYSPAARILFAEQVQVPRTQEERRLLFRHLIALARLHPDREILFCEREIPKGGTRHRAIGAIDDFVDDLSLQAPNLIRHPGGFREALANADFVLSVSSTACIEALLAGVPAAFIGDFTSSGADKFTDTGLLMALHDVLAPREIEISDAFFAEVGARDSWDQLLALASPRDRGGAEGIVLGTVIAPFTPTMTTRDALFGALGRVVPASSGILPIDSLGIDDIDRLGDGVAPVDAQRMAISDSLRVGGRLEPAQRILPIDGAYPLALHGSAFVIHLDVKLADTHTVTIRGRAGDREFLIRIVKSKINFEGITAYDLVVDPVDVIGAAGPIGVVRLRAFSPFDLVEVTIKHAKSTTPKGTVFVERGFFPSDVRSITRHRADIRATDLVLEQDVVVLLAPLSAHAFAPQSRLVAFESIAGDRLTLSLTSDNAIEYLAEFGGGVERRTLPSADRNVVFFFLTRSMTVLLINENVIVLDAAFVPTSIDVGTGDPEQSALFDVLEIFEGPISAAEINRTIELVTLRLFDGEQHKEKHQPIPDFRKDLEKRYGVTSPDEPATEDVAEPAKAMVAKKSAKGDVGTKTVNASSADPAKKPAKPVVAKSEQAVSAKAARAQLASKAPLGDRADMPVLAEASRSPADLSLAALDAKRFDEAISISEAALKQTPDSTRHMILLSRALERLNRVDEALAYVERACALKPIDALIDRRDKLRIRVGKVSDAKSVASTRESV